MKPRIRKPLLAKVRNSRLRWKRDDDQPSGFDRARQLLKPVSFKED